MNKKLKKNMWGGGYFRTSMKGGKVIWGIDFVEALLLYPICWRPVYVSLLYKKVLLKEIGTTIGS